MDGTSLVRSIWSYTSWSAFICGTILNWIFMQLIIKHTPKPMEIYSKILMQTCITDFLFLLITVLSQVISFGTPKGVGKFLNGPIQITNGDLQIVLLLIYIVDVFLVYVSLFGCVAQFIYRYLVLNRAKSISLAKYFLIFITSLLVPLVFCILLGIAYYPTEENKYLNDNAVAGILGLNITAQKVVLAGFATGGWLVNTANYYMLIWCTIAYVIICVIGWKMHKFVRNNRPINSNGNYKQQLKVAEMNRQVTLNLVFQACIPLTICVPLVIIFFCNAVLGIRLQTFGWYQYYSMLANVTWLWPIALNPVVTILIIRHYRHVFFKSVKMAFEVLLCRANIGNINATTMQSSGNLNNSESARMPPRDVRTRTLNFDI